MPFPISIKYKRTFTKKIDPETYSAILHNIENFILPKPAKDIVIEGNKLNFKPGAGFSNWNIMGAIDKGSFELTEKNGRVTLTYEIFMYRLFIVVPIMSVFFCFSSRNNNLGRCGLFALAWWHELDHRLRKTPELV